MITLLTVVGRNINTLRSDTEYPNFFRSGCLFLTKMIEGSRPYLERSDQNFYETPKFTWFSLRHIYVRVRYTCKYPSKLTWFGSNSVKLGVLYRIKIQKSKNPPTHKHFHLDLFFYFYFSRRVTTKPLDFWIFGFYMFYVLLKLPSHTPRCK